MYIFILTLNINFVNQLGAAHPPTNQSYLTYYSTLYNIELYTNTLPLAMSFVTQYVKGKNV